MKDLLKAVCKRISGVGGEVASIIRLQTEYGGGKTHGLIALVHAVHGMKGVANVGEFVDPSLLPKGRVRVAALDGENSDPADGLTLEGDLRAYSLWGELAYRLAGVGGYRRVQESDRKHIAPGADTLRELFGGEPTLIMLDEVSVYLRKVERLHPGASNQFTAFLQALIKAVESSPNAALVLTLAVGKDAQARDAYREEHERALGSLSEAEAIASRKATQLNPTEEDETADVLRRRLFDKVDMAAAAAVCDAYAQTWTNNRACLPHSAFTPEMKDQFRRGYPLHPETLAVLTDKVASLSTFQRTRGMLRLLARTVHLLWKGRPTDAFAIHPHHIDPGFGPIRDEITTRLAQGDYTPALKADVAAVVGDDHATAQLLDLRFYSSQFPLPFHFPRSRAG
jgi:predicted AAA+ superfamily ATPase